MIRDLNLELELRVAAHRPRRRTASRSRRATRCSPPRSARRARAAARARDEGRATRARELLAGLDVDYVEVAPFDPPVLAAAVRVGATRLIDNVPLGRRPPVSTPPAGKLPLPELAAMKRRGDKIVMVTAYDAPGARFAEDAGIDIVLVGDTAAMVDARLRGHDRPGHGRRDALPDADRVAQTRGGRSWSATCRSARTRCPTRTRCATRSASSRRAAPTSSSSRAPADARACARSSRPGSRSWAHIGLTPQSATMLGGFKTQGKTAEAARDARRRRARARGRRLRCRSCSRRSRRRSPRGSRPSSRSRRSGSAPARTATARCSSTTTCSG